MAIARGEKAQVDLPIPEVSAKKSFADIFGTRANSQSVVFAVFRPLPSVFRHLSSGICLPPSVFGLARDNFLHPAHPMHMPARIIALLILATGLMGCAANVDAPRALRGVLDLSAWDFAEHGPVALRGEWEFAWMESYDPVEHAWGAQAPARDFLTLPGLWQGETWAGMRLSPHGYGFYRLRIRISPDPVPMSLLISAPLSVCRVWVDGLVVGQTGTPGTDAESEKPVSHMLMTRFVPVGEVTEIVLQVSNFHNLQGGLNATIHLGTEKRITHLVLTRWILGAFVGGSLLALCVYHLTLFMVRRRGRANLFFALFCLMWTTAIAFSPSYAFPLPHVISLPWSWGVTFSLLPFGLIIPLMTIFYHELFPKRFGQ